MIEVEVTNINLRDMVWEGVSYWSSLCPSKINILGEEYITKEDVMRFYDMVVKDIARKVSQDYEKVREIIDKENTPFMDYVAQIFEKKKHYLSGAPQIYNLRRMLIVPKVDITLKCMVRLYRSLPNDKKEDFKNLIMEE